jgi:hypothetical protein
MLFVVLFALTKIRWYDMRERSRPGSVFQIRYRTHRAMCYVGCPPGRLEKTGPRPRRPGHGCHQMSRLDIKATRRFRTRPMPRPARAAYGTCRANFKSCVPTPKSNPDTPTAPAEWTDPTMERTNQRSRQKQPRTFLVPTVATGTTGTRTLGRTGV